MIPDPLPVPESKNKNAATYNALLEVIKIYTEVFWPATKILISPSGIELLFQNHARRALGLMYSLDRLDGPRHFQSSAATIRLLFEIAVDVELLFRRRDLGLSDDDAVRRHELVYQCMKYKEAYCFSKIPELDKGELASRCQEFMAENEERLYREVVRYTDPASMQKLRPGMKPSKQPKKSDEKKGVRVRKFDHWLGLNLRDRVTLLDSLVPTEEEPFKTSYEFYYGIASVYTHGGIAGLHNASFDEICGKMTILYSWAVLLCSEHIMRPICVELNLNQASPSVWEQVTTAKDAAERRKADFLLNSSEIWDKHLKSEGDLI